MRITKHKLSRLFRLFQRGLSQLLGEFSFLAGMRVRVDGLSRPCAEVRVGYAIQEPGTRRFVTLTTPVGADGWVRIAQPPAPWAQITRVDLEGLPGPQFTIGPFERL